MTCQKCHKNHATFHLTVIEKGVRELHLCEECARKAGVGMQVNFSIVDLQSPPAEEKTAKSSPVRCPGCGLTYSEFKSKGRLGCANDYEVFRGELLRLLERVHGATEHVGKAPRTADAHIRLENELLRLKRDLESMVRSENFEKAAEIRDRIRNLEAELNR